MLLQRASARGTGGRKVVYGWRIWLRPSVYIEAEHHSVWCGPAGDLVDITPTSEGETRILFVRDDAVTYDFETGRRRSNVRHAIARDQAVAEYLAISARIGELVERHSLAGTSHVPAEELRPLVDRGRELVYAIYHRYLGPNDLCTCHSGRKVKKCYGMKRAVQPRFDRPPPGWGVVSAERP